MNFDRWFYEVENFSLRSERFFEDLVHYQGDNPERVIQWIKAAYEEGHKDGFEEGYDVGFNKKK
jgi:hypothetical protein